MDVLTAQERAVMMIALMVVCSLAVLYWVMSPLSDGVGEGSVSLTGEVLHLKKTATGGHLLITMDVEGKLVSVFVSEDAGALELNEKLHVGDVLNLRGRPQLYRGEEEVVVLNERDITVMPP